MGECVLRKRMPPSRDEPYPISLSLERVCVYVSCLGTCMSKPSSFVNCIPFISQFPTNVFVCVCLCRAQHRSCLCSSPSSSCSLASSQLSIKFNKNLYSISYSIFRFNIYSRKCAIIFCLNCKVGNVRFIEGHISH